MNEQFTWLHIGLGSFHRAHQAWYLHRLQVMGDKHWSIAAEIFVTMLNMSYRHSVRRKVAMCWKPLARKG